ncbi:DUF1289 domain-containing protein [Morganella psychrotolerans]|uniref:DUF1289 domain-containing protein n=1 Tax=Morganella psychrotolerans TaxID=368603 RepID=UPI0039AF190D
MAEQLHLFDIPSPCVGICELSEKGYCKGCYRSRDERFQWLSLNNAQKENVLRLCRQRRYRAQKSDILPDEHSSQIDLF